MDEKQQNAKQGAATPQEQFSGVIGAKEQRKVRARRMFRNTWFGFGFFGLIGWSVAIPALLGTAIGVWIDSRHPGRYSWTLMLLVGGLGLGCLNAWRWVSREHQTIRREQENKDNSD